MRSSSRLSNISFIVRSSMPSLLNMFMLLSRIMPDFSRVAARASAFMCLWLFSMLLKSACMLLSLMPNTVSTRLSSFLSIVNVLALAIYYTQTCDDPCYKRVLYAHALQERDYVVDVHIRCTQVLHDIQHLYGALVRIHSGEQAVDRVAAHVVFYELVLEFVFFELVF